MKHWTIYLVLGLFAAVLMLGCSKKDKDFEVVVERDNESIQIKGEDAELTIGEKSSIPDEFPSDIPIYPGLEIFASMTEKEEKLFSVQGKTSDNSEDVIAFYKKKLSNEGWQEKMTINAGGVIIAGYEKSDRMTNLSISQDKDGTNLGISVVRK